MNQTNKKTKVVYVRGYKKKVREWGYIIDYSYMDDGFRLYSKHSITNNVIRVTERDTNTKLVSCSYDNRRKMVYGLFSICVLWEHLKNT